MSESLLSTIRRYDAIEQQCGKHGVTVTELRNELQAHPSINDALEDDLTSIIYMIVSKRNLTDFVNKHDTPASTYLNLIQALEATISTGARHRELHIVSSDEWAQRAAGLCQQSLFDEPHHVNISPSCIDWDDDGKPFA